ncbi:polygalacturonase inhibitor-like [Andrographis paniculata]|uniref:polygalacturonase inhibitor-like n=1 Tax=Andrographis paniculata TaxID=175694 RepID=UPI0021E948F5|nr:polygalacturonase inhibitor-like [Andrographis paniculata]
MEANSKSFRFIFFFFFLSSSVTTVVGRGRGRDRDRDRERCNPNDKKALLQIKKDLNNPYDLISWDPQTDCCDWLVVGCDEATNRIDKLVLSQADLNLPLPAAVGDLPYLRNLAFHHTNLTGRIPEAITKLSKLSFLDLRRNHLTGPVPPFLGQLKELTYIGLSFNSFTGSIPASLGRLPKLGGLLIDRNRLTGSIPASFGGFQVEDFALYLSHNELSGPIPSALGKASFYIMDVSRNMLEGDISFFFQEGKILNTADFSRNRFSFDMSKIRAFPEKLVNLALDHNRLGGGLPESLTKLDLISFNVSYNRLCGKIPVGGTGRLQELDYTAYIHNKCLCGAPLPPCKFPIDVLLY